MGEIIKDRLLLCLGVRKDTGCDEVSLKHHSDKYFLRRCSTTGSNSVRREFILQPDGLISLEVTADAGFRVQINKTLESHVPLKGPCLFEALVCSSEAGSVHSQLDEGGPSKSLSLQEAIFNNH